MLKIRLRRMGAKKAPFYRIVVADSRAPRDGAFVEEIGYYNPLSNPVELTVNNEHAAEWIKKGAQPTDTVRALLKKSGAIEWEMMMEELVRFIARNLVDEPDSVKVESREEGDTVVISLSVAPGDMGKVIGRQGRIAKAIRTVVKAASVREDKKYMVDIVEQ